MRTALCFFCLLVPASAAHAQARDADAEVAAVNLARRLGGTVTVVADIAVAVHLVDNRKLTDQHLEIIGKLPHVRLLDLSGSRITDAGARKLLELDPSLDLAR